MKKNNVSFHSIGSHLSKFATIILLIVLFFSLQPAFVTYAATITVNSFSDNLIAGDGNCTLREAIMNANSATGDTTGGDCAVGDPGVDTITLPAGTYTLALTGIGEDGNATGDLDITDAIIINGAGAGVTIIDGNGAVVTDRVIHTHGSIDVTMNDLTIQNGQIGTIGDGFGSGNFGGGIYHESSGALNLTNVDLLNNLAGHRGGGLETVGTSTLTNCTISGNQSSWGGGLVRATVALTTITNTTFSDNSVSSRGGALHVNSGFVVIENSVFSGNLSAGDGGGLSNGGTLSITNSTISGNGTTGNGGGIYTAGGTTAVSNSTITNNTAGAGEGIYNSSGTITLENTIVSGNGAANCQGTITDNGNNLEFPGVTCGGFAVQADPLLAPLADNGGLTQTHALGAGSPAIDAGNNATCAGSDQRGVTRPLDGDGDGTATCDIGAYELSVQVSIADTAVTEGDSGSVTAAFVVTLSPTVTHPVTVTYTTVNGTAIAGSDYTAVSGAFTFAPGESQRTVNVPVLGDVVDESDEDFFVNLSNVQGADIADGQAVGDIVDNDTAALSVSDAAAIEGSSGVFTVTLSVPSAMTVTVDYATADGTAVAGLDYTAASGTVTFAPGIMQQNITVQTVEDVIAEPQENFQLLLSNAVNAALDDALGVGIINDNDAATLSVSDAAAVEGSSSMFTVTLSTPSALTVTVDYATADGTALAGLDYIAASGTLTFTPGVTQQNITVQTVQDAVDEPQENFQLLLSNAVNATLNDAQGVGTIIDNDVAALSVSDADAIEGSSDVFTVTLSIPSAMTVTVDYATADGTAVAGSDYIVASGTLTFTPGVTQQTIAVQTVQDVIDEPQENFQLLLSNAVNAAINDAQGVGTITDDDTAALSVDDITILEGDTGDFTVTLSTPSALTVTVDYATVDGTAVAGSDYIAASGTLTFTPGITLQVVAIQTIDDVLPELQENFQLLLSNAVNAALDDAQGVGAINDNDSTGLSVSDADMIEGGSGVFTVTLSVPSALTVTVDYATADGTAVAGSDYITASGTLTFTPGVTLQNITIQTVDDGIAEPQENFQLLLSNAVNATFNDAQGVGTIDDNETAALSIGDITVIEGSTGVFTVTLSTPSAITVTVDYATSDGTAVAGQDYIAASGTLTFTPGVMQQNIAIQILDDTLTEPQEEFQLLLSNAQGATIADGSATCFIDNLAAYGQLQFASAALTVQEDVITATITVTRVNGSFGAVSVDYATSDGTAVAGEDYTAVSGTLDFADGETSKTFTITIINDILVEGDETVNLALSNPTGGATLGTPSQAVMTIVDTGPPYSIYLPVIIR